MRARFAIGAVMLLLAGCSQADAPSQEVEQAAEEVVSAAEGEVPPAGTGPYAPRNECAELPEAAGFMRALNQAVSARDVAALAALAADDIKLDFGGGSGTAELRTRLAAADGALWDELAQLATLGCAVNAQGGITLPWYFEQQVPVRDPFGAFIVTGENVPVYSAPGVDAPVVGRLSWEAVELVPQGREYEGYRHIEVAPRPPEAGPGGSAAGGEADTAPAVREGGGPRLTGYVADDALRSLVDYRLTAASRNGRWRIISFVRGD